MYVEPQIGDSLKALNAVIDGEVYGDTLHRLLYSQDASVYQEEPLGVAFPRNRSDVQQIVRMADAYGFSLIPRAAGTNLAGNCVGGGLVIDTGRYMNQILELNVEERWVRVQPGVVLDDLNRFLAPHGLFFGPDTSTSNRCMIGGMIGNNSCGSHSILYGNTMAHVLEVCAVFSDGEHHVLGTWSESDYRNKIATNDCLGRGLRTLDKIVREHKELIKDRYPHPNVRRRNTGYPLDDIVNRAPFSETSDEFSLARFLCGTEGTLAITTEAKLNLVPLPKEKLIVCVHFASLDESLRATVETVKHNPAAVELIDKRTLDQTANNVKQQANRFFIEGDPEAILVVEFYRDSQDDLNRAVDALIDALKANSLGYSYPVLRAPQDKAVWELRKAGLGILMGIEGDVKPVTVVEDTAVAVDVLPDYIREFAAVMDAYQTKCVYYAHASVGELHLRPELNLKDPNDVEKFKGIARDVADLVRKYRGAISGEHGDGRIRSPLLERFYGPEIMAIHREIKEAFDPKYVFNPGIIVEPKPIDADFRFPPGKPVPEIKTYFQWSKDLGLVRATEKCNGAGVCRRHAEAGGVMCPSYMATRNEKDSTRGRANIFRTLLTGEDPQQAFQSKELREALDLCLSCKGCKTECPANVDMAKMKAEFLQHYYTHNGTPLGARFFGHFRVLSRLASPFAVLVNFMMTLFIIRWVMDKILHISIKRKLPDFASRRFSRLYKQYRQANPLRDGIDNSNMVWLYIDPFTEYNDPHIGIAAVKVLEKAGYGVEILPIKDDGRTLISKGLVQSARQLTQKNLSMIQSLLESYPDRPVIGIEPSSLLTFRDETLDLADPDLQDVARKFASLCFLFDEFIDQSLAAGNLNLSWPSEKEPLLLHGHCHQKALIGTGATERILKAAGYDVTTLNTGCCGMAGSFGYESNHYDISMQIGELILFPALREEKTKEHAIAAPGTSCRHQIADGVSRRADHPAILLANRLGI